MALFFCCGRILGFLLLIATLLFSISSADQALIDTICSTTNNKTLCLQVLKDSADADRVGLGETAANAALGQIKLTEDLIYSLAKRAPDPGYYDFLTLYFSAIRNLYEYKTSIANKDFHSASIKASDALTAAELCSVISTNMPLKLKEANQKDKDYISIPLSVSHV